MGDAVAYQKDRLLMRRDTGDHESGMDYVYIVSLRRGRGKPAGVRAGQNGQEFHLVLP